MRRRGVVHRRGTACTISKSKPDEACEGFVYTYDEKYGADQIEQIHIDVLSARSKNTHLITHVVALHARVRDPFARLRNTLAQYEHRMSLRASIGLNARWTYA